MPHFKVSDLLDESYCLNLEPVFPGADFNREILGAAINRPGLALAGFFEQFAADRVQVLGRGEAAYIHSLNDEEKARCADRFFSFEIPCLIFSHSGHPSEIFLEVARKKNIPVFTTSHSTRRLSIILNDIIDLKTSPRTIHHGVLLEVFGIGVLLSGKTGVGKSEAALELIEMGHRLIADDAVSLYKRGELALHGTVSENIAYHMEIRGLGIINIKDLYGAGSVRKDIRVDLVVELEEWQNDRQYDRTGLDEKITELLGIPVPYLLIPVKPGRNIPLLIETAAKNYRLKGMGYHPARAFNESLMRNMQIKNDAKESNG